MQPNKAATPWGSVAGLVTGAAVLSVIVLFFSLLTILPGTGWSTSGYAPSDSLCTSVTSQDAFDDENAFRPSGSDGETSAPVTTAVCKPFDRFDHPAGARFLTGASQLVFALMSLLLLLGLRRIIRRSHEEGPFSVLTAADLRLFRFGATGVAVVAVTLHWIVRGVTADVVANEAWPDPMFWPPIVLFIALTVAANVCDAGARQREAAASRGSAESPGPTSPDDQ